MRARHKSVEQSGGRKHREIWSEDIEDIFARLMLRIDALRSDNAVLREQFEVFHDTLKTSSSASVSRVDATKMMAQHMITRPIFKALFKHHNANPISRALDVLCTSFENLGIEDEIRSLEEFYKNIRSHIHNLDTNDARQRMLMDIYERFFFTTTRKDSERLGIVYTPIEIVDFILASADHVTRSTFKRGLTDKGVHILDPFTGTGIFLVRLLQSKLIESKDLKRKYRKELCANEIVLLAYYIAIVHIEDAFHRRKGAKYKPFKGVALTDTFTLCNERSNLPSLWQSESTSKRKKKDIQVIIGNPPWSVGQKSSADDNQNVVYPEMRRRIAETYVAQSTATLKSSIYDTYKMAIRWASDKIGRQGVIAFVTNGSFLDSHVDTGIRACLAEEFNTVHVVNLRGNARTSGERRRTEGGKVFGQGARTSVAIAILAKTPNPTHQGCRILYRDIGYYLTREDKLKKLCEWKSIAGIEDWEEIVPDQHYDWIGQRRRHHDFQALYPLGTKKSKAGKTDDAIFRLYSGGYLTSRDAYIYNFSRETCARNARLAVQDYMGAFQFREKHPECTVEDATKRYSSHIRWNRVLLDNLMRRKSITYSSKRVWATQYRPFVKQYCYVEHTLANGKYLQDRIFPSSNIENRAIYVMGIGSTKPFSVLMVDTMPDFDIISKGQGFPRYRYERQDGQKTLPGFNTSRCIDNISDTVLDTFQTRYADDSITKDNIFDYIYGVLHSPEYRERFASNLAKSLPRVPMVQDVQSFHAFAKSGRQLSELHLGYETCEEYPLSVEVKNGNLRPEHCHLGTRAMRYADKEKTILVVNKYLTLAGIPHEAHEYEVNGRSPLGWLIDRYRISQDKESGIVNDPNAWFKDPRDLIKTIRRIVYVSVETVRIIKGFQYLYGIVQCRKHHDFQALYPLGTKKSKAGKADDAIFHLYSCGYLTSRDAHIYNFSRETCARNARAMVKDYQGALKLRKEHPECTVEDAAKRYSSCVRWDRELKNNLRRCKKVVFSRDNIWPVQHRPFVKQYCYVDYTLANNKFQQDSIFPSPDTENRAICVPGVGSTSPFSILMVDTMPDLHFLAFGQCFPRYRFEHQNGQQALPGFNTSTRIDNISDTALHTFQMKYEDDSITKDSIFDYIYGVLHSPEYRECFAENLTKSLPRVPLVQDAPSFHVFAKAGRQLGKLHLEYETCEEYPLEVPNEDNLSPKHCRLGTRAMRYADKEKTILVVNDHLKLAGIPPEVHEYEINGRSPLGWIINRYRISQDQESGIVSDPNAWFEDPRDIIETICRIVHVSVETMRIVKGLPTLFELDMGKK